MKTKLQLVLAIAGACLTTGCIVAPYHPRPRAAYYRAPAPPVEFVEPRVLIVERGVRHDRSFYKRHPEIYWRDRERYPGRFAHLPPPRHGSQPIPAYRGPGRGGVPQSHAVQSRSGGVYIAARQAVPQQDVHKKKKKKKGHDHDDR